MSENSVVPTPKCAGTVWDALDSRIVGERYSYLCEQEAHEFDYELPAPMAGEWIVFTDGPAHRVARWRGVDRLVLAPCRDGDLIAGAFHFDGDGLFSYQGLTYELADIDYRTLILPQGHRRPGRAWIHHHDDPATGAQATFTVPVREWRMSVQSPAIDQLSD